MAIITSGADWEAAIETFNGTVVHAYQQTDMLGTDKMMFDSRPMGESVNYPIMKNMAARNEPDGWNILASDFYGRKGQPTTDGPSLEVDTTVYYPGPPVTGIPGTDNPDVLPGGDVSTKACQVDPVLKENRLIPRDQLVVRPDLRLPENYAMKLGRAIAEGKYIRCLNYLAGAAVELTQQVGLAISNTSPEEVSASMRELASNMDQFGIPNDDGGRHVFLHSPQWYLLLAEPGVITKEYGGQANVQRPGAVINYANLTIHKGTLGFGVDFTGTDDWDGILIAADGDGADTYEASTKYVTDMSTISFVAWHKEAWVLRHWEEPSTDIDWVSINNSFKVESRMMMGTRIIQNEGIWYGATT